MTPQLVQEALPATPRIAQEQFVFLVCQHGTEATLKARWTGESSGFRLAFSRPGLLTLKIDEPAGLQIPAAQVTLPEDWMIRQCGLSLGQLRGEESPQLIEQTLKLSGFDWDTIHVFERDRGLPGDRGFEPGPTELSKEIGKRLLDAFRQSGSSPNFNTDADPGDRVLDVVLVEPNHWLIGHHRAMTISQRWPGGAYSVSPPNEMISRAYLKMAEAVAWSGLPFQPDDEIAEIGSAPGGACQRLLDLGMRVTGIDPAEMDPMLLGNSRFEHWRSKSAGVRRKRYAKFRWLAADANVAPNYTLDCVEDIVNYPTSRIQGLLLTLKLSSYDLAGHMQEYLARIRGWGYPQVEVRQLASNRRECCVVAHRPDVPRGERASKQP